MSERYEQLSKSSDYLYTIGSPLVVSAYALLKDTHTDGIVAQVKFQSISNNRIIAVYTDFIASDISGNPLNGIDNFQYLDLNAKRNDSFGSKVAVNLPDNRTRQLSICVKRVVFSDNTSWDVPEGATWTVITAHPIESVLEDKQLVEQYARTTGISGRYAPNKIDDLWLCACGSLNKEEESKCHSCNTSKDSIFNLIDEDILNEELRQYKSKLEEDKIRKLEHEHAENVKKKRKVKIYLVIAVVLILLVTSITLFITVIDPAMKYKQAEELLNNQLYEECLEIFVNLGEYKDSADRVNETILLIQYSFAMTLFDNEDYLEAADAFCELGEFQDSMNMHDESRYMYAQKEFNAGNFSSSYTMFSNLSNYKDSVDMRRESAYLNAQKLTTNGMLAEANSYLNFLVNIQGGYKDSVEILYFNAQSLLSNGQITDAYVAYRMLGDYQDSERKRLEIFQLLTTDDTCGLIGTWEFSDGGFIGYFHNSNIVIFLSDGSIYRYEEDDKNHIYDSTWSLNPLNLILHIDFGYGMYFDISLSGDTLTIIDKDKDARTYNDARNYTRVT